MAVLSPQQFEANIKPRAVLYFAEEALNTTEPHFFICICTSIDGELIFSCCTSQFTTVKNLIERNRYPRSTLAYIPYDNPDNPFSKPTYVNCNEYFAYRLSELWDLYLHNKLSFYGDLPLHSFEQILIGLNDSEQIEDELKECFPTIDDL